MDENCHLGSSYHGLTESTRGKVCCEEELQVLTHLPILTTEPYTSVENYVTMQRINSKVAATILQSLADSVKQWDYDEDEGLKDDVLEPITYVCFRYPFNPDTGEAYRCTQDINWKDKSTYYRDQSCFPNRK